MEIRSPSLNRVTNTRTIAKTNSKKSVDSFSDSMHESTTNPVTQSNIVLSVDPMFMNTEESSPARKSIQQGLSLLDELDKFKNQLVCGTISPATVNNIYNYVSNLDKQHLDTDLKNLLLEVETRAIVELTKHKLNR